MSYEINRGRTVSQANAQEFQRQDAADLAFLKKLDASDLIVSEWEASFIESALQREAKYTTVTFSPAQRESIVKMRRKYEPDL